MALNQIVFAAALALFQSATATTTVALVEEVGKLATASDNDARFEAMTSCCAPTTFPSR
jgi:hypothetical protein